MVTNTVSQIRLVIRKDSERGQSDSQDNDLLGNGDANGVRENHKTKRGSDHKVYMDKHPALYNMSSRLDRSGQNGVLVGTKENGRQKSEGEVLVGDGSGRWGASLKEQQRGRARPRAPPLRDRQVDTIHTCAHWRDA
jgi:hypothetical protein